MENIQELLDWLYRILTRYGIKFLAALAVLIVGLLVIR